MPPLTRYALQLALEQEAAPEARELSGGAVCDSALDWAFEHAAGCGLPHMHPVELLKRMVEAAYSNRECASPPLRDGEDVLAWELISSMRLVLVDLDSGTYDLDDDGNAGGLAFDLAHMEHEGLLRSAGMQLASGALACGDADVVLWLNA